MSGSKWWIEAALARTKESASAVMVIGALFWFIGKPMVDAYIETAIAEQGYASQGSVINLQSKVFDASKSLKSLNDGQVKQTEQLRNIENSQKETRELLIKLLSKQQ